MKIRELEIPGPLVIQLDVYADLRGFFVERFHEEKFRALGIPHHFIQDNHSRSAPNVLRGLHFQKNPDQGKLVGVVRGKIFDVVVDLRSHSECFGKWIGFTLESTSLKQELVWVPPGFAHGFCVMGVEEADVIYKVDQTYNPRGEGGIHWKDPILNIAWPISLPTVSERDNQLPSWQEFLERKGK